MEPTSPPVVPLRLEPSVGSGSVVRSLAAAWDAQEGAHEDLDRILARPLWRQRGRLRAGRRLRGANETVDAALWRVRRVYAGLRDATDEDLLTECRRRGLLGG